MKRSTTYAIPLSIMSLTLMLTLAGCGDVPGADAAPQAAEPTFSGPWAEDFQRNYDDAGQQGNTFAQDVLRDGRITEAEATEAVNRYASCMKDAGFALDYVNPDGSSQMSGELTDAENARYGEADGTCDASSGSRWITALYNAVAGDPNGDLRNRSDEEARQDLADCLKRKGVVGDEFTAKDIPEVNASGDENWEFQRQFVEPGGRYYSERNTDILTQCNMDPRQ